MINPLQCSIRSFDCIGVINRRCLDVSTPRRQEIGYRSSVDSRLNATGRMLVGLLVDWFTRVWILNAMRHTSNLELCGGVHKERNLLKG